MLSDIYELFCVIIAIAALIQVTTQRARIDRLEREAAFQRKRIDGMEAKKQLPASAPPAFYYATPESLNEDDIEFLRVDATEATKPVPAPAPEQAHSVGAPARKASHAASLDIEEKLGARLPVWIGGAAMALAGLFLVKYSIDAGLLSPLVRVCISTLFGLALFGCANPVRRMQALGNAARLAQGLCGAGLAVLYGCAFAATSLYHLLPPVAGLVLMGLITIAALRQSLRFGMPIAALGLAGGLLSPLLVGNGGPVNVPMLYLYLYCVLACVLAVSRRSGWTALSLAAGGGAALWILFGLTRDLSPFDGLALELFILLSAATLLFSLRHARMDSRPILLTGGGAIVFLGLTTAHLHFDWVSWGLIGCVSAAALALAGRRFAEYRFGPPLTVIAVMVLLADWQEDAASIFAVLAVFSFLHLAAGYALLWRNRADPVKSLFWGRFACAAAIGYAIIGAVKLHVSLTDAEWGGVAVALAALFAAASAHMLRCLPEANPARSILLDYAAWSGSAAFALGMALILPMKSLPPVYALQLAVTLWLAEAVPIPALKRIPAALAALFITALVPETGWILRDTLAGLQRMKYGNDVTLPEARMIVLNWILPAACFAYGASRYRHAAQASLAVRFGVIALALTVGACYWLMAQAIAPFAPHFDAGGLTRDGILGAGFLALAFVFAQIGKRLDYQLLRQGGLILALLALARLFYDNLLLYSPLDYRYFAGATPFFNLLLLHYALPMGMILLANRRGWLNDYPLWNLLTPFTLFAQAFLWVTFSVRIGFHSGYLDAEPAMAAEIYAYSAAWIVLGVALLVIGARSGNRLIRLGALALLALAVCKVFLYDAAELTGLLRVVSFLGLGVCLLALSSFYTRFIARENRL